MKKRRLLMILAAVMLFSLTACSGSSNTQGTASPTDTASSTPETTKASMAYAFTLKDIEGKTYSLSDYAGKPVYLKVWASWCGYCVSSLPDLDELTEKTKDFVVLSVVFPGTNGEMSRDDFIKWYKALGYDHIIVLMDESGQIRYDFGIRAYPYNVMFDARGNVAETFSGLVGGDAVTKIMQKIAEKNAAADSK